MKVVLAGRGLGLYRLLELLPLEEISISGILTSKPAPEYEVTSEDFARFAESHGVPFLHSSRREVYEPFLESLEADILISAQFTSIFNRRALEHFPLGGLNVHGGDLPRFRGNACQAWAILSGESRIGLCVHRMVADEIDSGDIIAREYLPISLSTKIGTVFDWINERTAPMLLKAINELDRDPGFYLEKQSVNPSDSLRCYPRKPEDGKIDWNVAAEDVLRLVNACNRPYPGAFCNFHENKMIIWDAELSDSNEPFLAVPGQVADYGEGWVDVACGSGKIRLLKVEIDGKVGSPTDWVTSRRHRLN